MTARQQAIKDIREELRNSHKSFIMFRTELNKKMLNIVNEQLKAQRQLKKKEKQHGYTNCSYIPSDSVDP